MKKAVLIAVAIAILGGLSLYTVKSGSANTISNTAANPSPTSASPGSPSIGSSPSPTNTSTASKYKDGTYNGISADTPYGPVKVAITISSGQISDVQFLEMPSDEGHSREVTAFSEPLLEKHTLSTQNADLDFISGATSTCYGYQESLQSALDKASGTAYIRTSNS